MSIMMGPTEVTSVLLPMASIRYRPAYAMASAICPNWRCSIISGAFGEHTSCRRQRSKDNRSLVRNSAEAPNAGV